VRHYLQVGLVVGLPDLVAQTPVGVDQSVDVPIERTNGHALGQERGEGLMEAHFIFHIFEVVVVHEKLATRMMVLEGAHI
jgi:hypothetical protein